MHVGVSGPSTSSSWRSPIVDGCAARAGGGRRDVGRHCDHRRCGVDDAADRHADDHERGDDERTEQEETTAAHQREMSATSRPMTAAARTVVPIRPISSRRWSTSEAKPPETLREGMAASPSRPTASKRSPRRMGPALRSIDSDEEAEAVLATGVTASRAGLAAGSASRLAAGSTAGVSSGWATACGQTRSAGNAVALAGLALDRRSDLPDRLPAAALRLGSAPLPLPLPGLLAGDLLGSRAGRRPVGQAAGSRPPAAGAASSVRPGAASSARPGRRRRRLRRRIGTRVAASAPGLRRNGRCRVGVLAERRRGRRQHKAAAADDEHDEKWPRQETSSHALPRW